MPGDWQREVKAKGKSETLLTSLHSVRVGLRKLVCINNVGHSEPSEVLRYLLRY